MKVEVKKFWFKNYNWFWPIVPTWGDIALRLIVEGSNGKLLFDKTFAGDGTSYCLTGKCAYETAIRSALSSILKSIVATCATDDFQQLAASGMPQSAGPRLSFSSAQHK